MTKPVKTSFEDAASKTVSDSSIEFQDSSITDHEAQCVLHALRDLASEMGVHDAIPAIDAASKKIAGRKFTVEFLQELAHQTGDADGLIQERAERK